MVDFGRREFVRAGLFFVGLPVLNGLDAIAKNLGSVQEKKESKHGISKYILDSHGKSILNFGNITLDIVRPEETGDAGEYLDPSGTGVPIVRVPVNLLDEKISRHFVLGEFTIVPLPARNKGTDIKMNEHKGNFYHQYARLDPRLVEALEDFRIEYGRPLKIISPFRNFTYNQKCGGKKHSRHLAGQAADIQDMNDNSAKRLAKIHYLADKQFCDGGVGYYPRKDSNGRFVHVDVRGSKARWTSKNTKC